MKRILRSGLITGMLLMIGVVAWGHFQMIYTPKAALTTEDASTIPLKLIFTHPFEGSCTMNMGEGMDKKLTPPAAFGVMTCKAEAEPVKTDLLTTLKPMQFKSLTNSGAGFESTYKLKGLGDFIFYVDPAMYWEPMEDCFIRHVTKVIVNRGGAPTCWDQPVGLEVEILPLVQPYALWTGNTFRGVVTKNGKPVPNAEIEVEHLNFDVDLEKNAFVKRNDAATAPQDAFVTQIIKANSLGEFSYAIPRAGWWGFAALGLTEEKYQGKDIELGALLWVQAQDMK